MKTRYLTNIFLLVFIIGLYWFINREATVTNENINISSLNTTHVTKIIIQRNNRDDIVLSKKSGDWMLISPINVQANDTRINLILGLLTTAPHNQFPIDSDLSLQQFELDSPKISVQLNEQHFYFGNIEPLSKHRYIRYNNTIYLIDDTVTPLLNANAASFINNRLIPKELHISRLTLPSMSNKESTTSTLTISSEDGHWQSTGSNLSRDMLTALIDAWQYAYATQVIPLSQDVLHDSIGQSISIELSNQTTVKLLLQFDERSMYLIDINKKLKYQFPLSIKQQFFPEDTIR